MTTIANSNRQFAKMTDAQKRIAIAEDVLKMLKSRKLIASKGDYCRIATRLLDISSKKKVQADLRDNQCTVCGIGAAAVAAICRFDNFRPTFDDYISGTECRYVLRKYFSVQQIGVIENAFEGFGCYGEASTNAKTRLSAIFRNIIKNGGTFKPPLAFGDCFVTVRIKELSKGKRTKNLQSANLAFTQQQIDGIEADWDYSTGET